MKVTAEGYVFTEEEFNTAQSYEKNGKKYFVVKKKKNREVKMQMVNWKEIITLTTSRDELMKTLNVSSHYLNKLLERDFGTHNFTKVRGMIESKQF